MDRPSTPTITELQHRLQTLRQSVVEMEDLLAYYLRSEVALRQSEEQFRLLVTNVREYAIFMLDADGYIVSWNTGAQLIKGYQADEIIGQHFSRFYLPEEQAAHKPERELVIATTEGVYKEEGWRVRKDGSLFWASVVITALYDDQGTLRGFGKVTRDLTERKHAEDAQRQLQAQELQLAREQAAREQAEADLQLRDNFLSTTAHDLRTPVTSLLGYAQLLQRRLDHNDATPEQFRKPVQIITLQAQRLNRLTTMLLDSSRLEHGSLVFERVSTDLRHAIEESVHELQLLNENHAIILTLPDVPLMVEGDELRLEQVIYNLVQNAIKYSPKDSRVTVTAHQDSALAVIVIKDEGIGIPVADLPHVFERFYRATNTTQTASSGLGLGLYLVKEFVEMQDGTVDVQSVVGQGTTFQMTLPLIR